jgi:hypothetical protein
METIRPEQLKATNVPVAGYFPSYNTNKQFEWVQASGGTGSGSTTFLDLTDTPDSYAGMGGDLLTITSGESSIGFLDVDFLEDAPENGIIYGRNNGTWVAISGAGTQSYPDHSFDWFSYFRRTAGVWSHTTEVATGRVWTVGWYQSSPANGDSAEIKLLLDAGTYNVAIAGISGDNRGRLDWYLDGVAFDTGQEWYSVSVTENVVKTATITISTGGSHTISVTVNGKHASSSNYYWLLTALEVNRQ